VEEDSLTFGKLKKDVLLEHNEKGKRYIEKIEELVKNGEHNL